MARKKFEMPTGKTYTKISYDSVAGRLQTFSNQQLLNIARRRINVVQLAAEELAMRGINDAGKWIGIDDAEKHWGVK